MFEKYKIGFSFFAGDMSALGHAICKKYDVDFAIMLNFNTGTINGRAMKPEIDLSQIMKTYFNGGGHPAAAGGNFDTNINDFIINNTIGKISPIKSIEDVKK